MLRQREFDECKACHLGKKHNGRQKSKLSKRSNEKRSSLIKQYVLSIVLVYPLKFKNAPEVKAGILRFILWTDRMALVAR